MAKRCRYFEGMAETSERENWPSSAIAACLVLTAEELEVIENAPFLAPAARARAVPDSHAKSRAQAILKRSGCLGAQGFRQRKFLVLAKPRPKGS
jgi:hypothetical protein